MENKLNLNNHTRYICTKEFALPLLEENESVVIKVGNLYEINTDSHDNHGGDIHLDLIESDVVSWIEIDEEILEEYFEEIVFFELNNWFADADYPAAEPFLTWIGNDLNIYFNNEDWIKENKLCVVKSIIDMSVNFCITTTKSWVEKNCPELLTKYTKFLRFPDEDGWLEGRFGTDFLEYQEKNIGITEEDDEFEG